MSAKALAESSPRFISTLKSQKVIENVDVLLSCSVSGNPEPEVTWYKGDKELTKALEPTKYEMLKDGKVHTIRLYRCTEDDAAVYQVSARNSRGIAICSSVLQVGLVTEAQVKQQMMQRLEERNRAKEAASSPRVNGGRGDGLVTTANTGLDRRARPTAEGGGQGSLERRPVGVAAYEGRMNSLDEAQASAVTRRPNTGKSRQLKEVPETGAGSHMTLSVGGDQSCTTRSGDVSGAASPRRRGKLSRMSDFSCEGLRKDAAEQCSPAYLSGARSSLTPVDHYYLDLLVCSDVLTEEGNAAWRGKLESAAHLLLLSEEHETEPVKLSALPAPLGQPACKRTTMDLHGPAPPHQPESGAVGNEGRACSTRASTLLGSFWTSEESRARPGEGGAQSCPIPPQMPVEVEIGTRQGERLKRSPASTERVQEVRVGGQRDEWVSGNRIDVDKLDRDKPTDIKKGEVLKKEFGLKLPSTEDSPEDTHGGVTPSPGELAEAGEMYNSLLGTDFVQSPALRLSANENCDSAAGSGLQRARGRHVQTPPRLKNDSTRMEGECTRDREETAVSSEEKGGSSPDKAGVQPLLLKDEATSFIKSATNLLFEDGHMACMEKKANLSPLDINVTLSSTQNSHDQEPACGRLEKDSEILSHPPILDSAISQSNEFKDKYQVQVLQEKKSSLISRDNKLFCTSKEHQGSIYEPKIESTMHFIDSLKIDCFIESEKSDLGENTPVCNKEQEPLKNLSELCIHNENTDHQSSITSEGFECTILKKISKDESIDPCLGILPHISTPAQIKDISEPLHIGSSKFRDNENKSNEESNYFSYCDTSNAVRDDEIPFQVSEYFGNESKQMNAHRDESEHSESSFGVTVNDWKLGVHKELNGQSEEHVLENESSQTDSPNDHWLPLNRAEILCVLNASENKVHKEDISTHRSIGNDQTAENEAISCSDSLNKNEMQEFHNSNGIPSSPETNKLAAVKLDVKLTVDHPILFEYNLDIPLKQLIPKYLTFDSENNGSDYLSNKMESKTENILAEPFMVNHQEAITSPLIDCEKMQYHKLPLLESPCCNSTDNKIKSNDKQFSNSVGFPSTEDEYSNTRLRTDQNSETMFPLKHFVELQNTNEPEVVKSDNLKSSVSQIDKNISPLIGTNEQKIINSKEKTVVKEMEHSEYPTHNEQRSSIAHPVVNDQSLGIQQIFRPDQNSMKHVVEKKTEDEHRTLKTVNHVQTIPIINSEPSLFNGPNVNLTKIICSTFQNESNFQCLSIPEPDKMKGVDNVHETAINPSGNIMCLLNPSLHFDEPLFPSPTSQVEKCTLNHNICSAGCDSELGHDHVNNKTTSSKNLAFVMPSVSPIETIPSKAELVKGINIMSPTADLNENFQKAEYVPDLKAKPSEISNTIENDSKIMESQAKEGQSINCRANKTAAVIEDGNKTEQQRDSVHLASMNSRGLSIITQQMAGQIMNVNSTAVENCREHNQSNLSKSTDQIIVPDHPLEDAKVDIEDESEVKVCQISMVPSKGNQKSSEVSNIENVTQTKNDNQAKTPGTETLNRSLDEAQKRTTEPKYPISLQSRSLFKKSIPAIESPSTAVRIKQPFPVQPIKDPMMSDGRKRSNFPNSSRDIASKFGILFPSQNEQQKKEVKQVLSVDNIKLTLDKNKYVHSSAGKENLNKKPIVVKRTFHKTKEEPAYTKEEKEVENEKHSHKDEHKELDSGAPPKLIQKIHAEVPPDIPGNVKLWCRFGDIHADSNIIWTKDGVILTKGERSAGDDTPVSLAIVQTTEKDRGLYQCALKNVHGSVSCEFDFTTEVLNALLNYKAVEGNSGKWEDPGLSTPQKSAAEPLEIKQLKSCNLSMQSEGEKIELLQPIIEKELTSECSFQPKIHGSIATDELHFGEGLHRKAFRTNVIYGLVPLFDPGHSCVLKIHTSISYGTKTKSEIIQRNYFLAVQECHVQNAARQYGNMFSAVGTLLEGFGETPEIIPIYLIHRPANNIPYATVEEELIGDFVKYSVKDGRELNVGRKDSEVGQKCCTFQHWVYEWTEEKLLVADLQGVGMKLTDIGIATCSKGYKGFKGNCSISFIDQFRALHQCNMYCKLMGLKSLKESQPKPRRNPPMKAPLSKPAPCSTKKMLVNPRSTIRNFTSQSKSLSGDRTIPKHLQPWKH